MRICDITREDEVIAAYSVIKHPLGESFAGENGDIVTTFEVGKRAADAIENQDWAALNSLTPHRLRRKDPKKSAAAKKAGATRRANRNAATAATGLAGGSEPQGGQHGAPSPSESAMQASEPSDEF